MNFNKVLDSLKHRMIVEFANAGHIETLVAFENEIQIGDDGWGQIAPLGDFPGLAYVPDGKGGIKKERALQRIDKEAITSMVNEYQASKRGLTRFIRSRPIFKGHPDVPGCAMKYPDKSPKGILANIALRDNGMFGEPLLTSEGEKLIADGHNRFSGRWEAELVNEENGVKIYRPSKLISVGLTPTPNLPVEMLNEQDTTMTKEQLIAFLKGKGVTIANDTSLNERELCQMAGVFPEFWNGDYPGHPFHGNQYVEGEDSSDSADRHSDMAEKASEKAHDTDTHLKARDAHASAMAHHDRAAGEAKKLGDKKLAKYHTKMAAAHEKAMNKHGHEASGGARAEGAKNRAPNFGNTTDMNKTKLAELLGKFKITVANDGTDEQFAAAIEGLGCSAAKAAEVETLKTTLANERKARIDEAVQAAINRGAITSSEATSTWRPRLETEATFANEMENLKKLTAGKVKTNSVISIDRNGKKVDIANASQRRELIAECIDEVCLEKHLDRAKDYQRAFNIVQARHPALFQKAA